MLHWLRIVYKNFETVPQNLLFWLILFILLTIENYSSAFYRMIWKKKNLCSCFVPHTQLNDYSECLMQKISWIENDTGFVDSIITGNETWCFAYNPVTKWQSMAWVGPKSTCATKLRFQNSKIKITLILFFESKRMVHKGFVPESQTVTKEFYLEVLGCLLKRIACVKPEM